MKPRPQLRSIPWSLLALATLAPIETASAQFGPPIPINARWGIGGSIRMADLDGDGLSDILYRRSGIQWAQRTGPESFAQPELLIADLPQVWDMELMDPDLDGDQDVVFVSGIGDLYMIRQEASGVVGFAISLSLSTQTRPFSLRIGDANGDGVEDLFVSTAGGGVANALTVEVMLGDGAGSFAPDSLVRVVGNSSIGDFAAADINGDGRDDVVISAGFDVQVAFSEPSGFAEPIVVATTPQVSYGVVAGEFDGDGEIYIAVAQVGAAGIEVFRNDGPLGFTQTAALPSVAGVIRQFQAADIDADGDLDLAVSADAGAAFFENTGLGSYASAVGSTIDPDSGSTGFLLADLDGDGPLDLVGSVGSPSDWSWARFQGFDSDPVLAPAQPLWGRALRVFAIEATDLDGDGDSEVLAATSESSSRIVVFDDLDQSPPTQRLVAESIPAVRQMRAEDVDGDGAIDLVTRAFSGEISWLRSVNGPALSAAIPIGASDSPARIEVVDLDGNGTQEVIVASSNTEIVRYSLDGTGSFGAPEPVAQSAAFVSNIRVVDIDGDAAPDLLIASRSTSQFPASGEVRWQKNIGGDFGPPTVLTNGVARDVQVVDLDSDGVMDLVWLGSSLDSGLHWLRGTGGGGFDASMLLDSEPSGSRFEVEDADLDGDDDFFVGGSSGYLSLWSNSAGVLAPMPRPSVEQLNDYAFGDFDLDGDRDLVVSLDDNSGTYLIPNFSSRQLGTTVCPDAVPHVQGESGVISATGSPQISANALVLRASSIPQLVPTFFLASTSTSVTFPVAGSVGRLCLGSPIGRYMGPGEIRWSGFERQVALCLDLQAMPFPQGMRPAAPGEIWYFQAWFRDSLNGNPTSNFTDALSITLR